MRDGKFLVITPTPVEAEDFLGDLKFFWKDGESHLFPSLDRTPFMGKYSGVTSVGERLLAVEKLSQNGPLVVVSSAGAILGKIPDPKKVSGRTIVVSRGRDLGFDFFKAFLSEAGYRNVTQVEAPGDFAVRGGIIDVFPPGEKIPVRVEFFGDYTESIRSFYTENQKSQSQLDEVTIAPVSQVTVSEASILKASEALRELSIENDWLNLLWEPIIDGFMSGRMYSDFENWSPLFEDNLIPFSKFVSNLNVTTILYEPASLYSSCEAAYMGLENHFKRLGEDKRPHLPLESLYDRPETILGEITSKKKGLVFVRELGFTDGSYGDGADHDIYFPTESTGDLKAPAPLGKVQDYMGPLVAKIRTLLSSGYEVVLVLRNKEQTRRLAELLLDRNLSPLDPALASIEDGIRSGGGFAAGADTGSRQGTLRFAIGQLSGGFSAPYDRECYISEEEIFKTKKFRRLRATEEMRGVGSFLSLYDLTPGDYVVHVKYGIGQYLGLNHLTMSTGYQGEFLTLEYRGGTKLHIPVETFGMVSKYVGASDSPPSLAKLGSGNWEKTKEKVKEDIKAKAEELLKLYARRSVTAGHAFSPPDTDFLNFEASFPYEETPDQEKAIADVLEDLEKPSPMDRLVCGDVGFGKTEVALRAAYKVVSDSKQAAILVPTTILAEQHERSFRERLSAWPVVVASVSRLKKVSEVKKILEDVRLGKVDILIGTHRILQKDVIFKDLGLLVIDEEHRFGVNDKEKLKKFRANVDVLSMSATPIPRSLSMSMAGIRDMSIIQTPPVFRLAVKTSLIRTDDTIIREAIDRELHRGGQVYFVHNEINDLHRWLERLQNLMPLVRFGVGHGRLKGSELEEVMRKFWKKEIDVWLTTTIVESGLDFPDANTIIIDQADKFGLAQLYQLKGRVGRSHEQAYCYLMANDPKSLASNARKRLQAIMENTDLGSGYQVAMHDMQIRGSGNVLGVAQSGAASLVGFEMYTHLVEEAVGELMDEPVMEEYEPEIFFGKPCYLPESYASDTTARIVLYRRLSRSLSDEEIKSIEEELKDRFGPLPDEAKNLLELSSIKILVKAIRAKRLELGEDGLRLSFFTDERNSNQAVLDKIVTIASQPKRKISLSSDGDLFVPKFNLKHKTLGLIGSVRHFLTILSS
jgi:transcription-repair coupling factor (superfamily II helicase)